MFHWSKGWFFQRLDNGDVRIVKTADGRNPPEAATGEPEQSTAIVTEAVIPASEWASVLTELTRRPHDQCLRFHQGEPVRI